MAGGGEGSSSGGARGARGGSGAYGQVPTFHLSQEDIEGGFEAFVERVEESLARAGACKLVPPASWTPRKAGYQSLRLHVPSPITQNASGGRGLWRHYNTVGKGVTIQEFREMVEQRGAMRPPEALRGDVDAMERHFWKNVTFNPPLYGADILGSVTDPSQKHFSIRRLNDFLRRALKGAGVHIPGVTEPYLYVGSWRADFAWHTEDMDLNSVNYIHFGESKTWYVVPPRFKERFEALAQEMAPELFDHQRGCSQFLRHKELLLSPALCLKRGIELIRLTQNEREFVITYPSAYHCGFNHGFNLAESTNFATRRWIPYGCAADYCDCVLDSVKLDMRLFGVEDEVECAECADDDVSSDDDEDALRVARARRARNAEKGRKSASCGLCGKRRLVSATRPPNWPGTRFICALLPDCHCRVPEEEAARRAELIEPPRPLLKANKGPAVKSMPAPPQKQRAPEAVAAGATEAKRRRRAPVRTGG